MKFYKILILVITYMVLPLFLPVQASEDFFLPLFYVPKKVIYSNMATNDLPEILSFRSYDVRTAFYLDKLNDTPDIGADNVLLKITPQGVVTDEIIDIVDTPLKLYLNNVTERVSEINKYEEEMTNAFNELEKLRITKNEKYFLWLKAFKEALSDQRVKADSLFSSGAYSIAEENYLRGLFAQYAKKITSFDPPNDPSFQMYEFKIPRAGEYQLFTKEDENKWSDPNLKFFDMGDNLLKIPIMTTPENLIGPGLMINNYLPDSLYKISFEYQQSDRSGNLYVVEGDTVTPLIKSLPSTGKEFESVEFFFISSPKAEKAKVRLLVGENKNLQVEKMSQPEIMLENSSDRKDPIPKITFRRINPTKYSIKVENATAPYHLVFSENFHKDWRLYLSKENSAGNDIIASYFDGAIEEIRHENVFLEKNIFQTWFKKPIAQNTHFKINGFANSWYITPQDVNGAENYELIVEFWPQRLYYLGFIISSLTLLVCLAIMGVIVLRKKIR